MRKTSLPSSPQVERYTPFQAPFQHRTLCFTNISTLATVQQLVLSNSPFADMSSILPATWENRVYWLQNTSSINLIILMIKQDILGFLVPEELGTIADWL